jgi:hypothetical protein
MLPKLFRATTPGKSADVEPEISGLRSWCPADATIPDGWLDDRKLSRNGLPGDRSFAAYLGSTDVLEADFCTAITSVLPVIRQQSTFSCRRLFRSPFEALCRFHLSMPTVAYTSSK